VASSPKAETLAEAWNLFIAGSFFLVDSVLGEISLVGEFLLFLSLFGLFYLSLGPSFGALSFPFLPLVALGPPLIVLFLG